MSIRIMWPPGLPGDVEVARQSYELFRQRGYVAKTQDGVTVKGFDGRLGFLQFVLPKTWMARLGDVLGEDADERPCDESYGKSYNEGYESRGGHAVRVGHSRRGKRRSKRV